MNWDFFIRKRTNSYLADSNLLETSTQLMTLKNASI